MLKISFDFDDSTKTVSNIKVVTVETPKIADDGKAIIYVDENKLVFSRAAIALLNAQPGDRINVNYCQTDNKTTFPVICKSSNTFDLNIGNKLTKSNTISYKGQQRDILLLHGNKFELETFKPEYFKLKKIN